ncbi:hypothetical protein GCM10023107_04100 [Actinoplanes octamycinicus]
MSAGREAVDVADVAEQAGGAGGADAVEAGQLGAGGGQHGRQLPVGCFDLGVQGGELVDQVAGQLIAGGGDDVAGRDADAFEQGAGLVGGQVLLRAAGDQFEQ